MEAVIEEHTRAATQMREMTTVDIGRIIGRLMVIHVRDGRKNMLSQDQKQTAFFRSRSGQLLRDEVQRMDHQDWLAIGLVNSLIMDPN